MNYQMTSPGTAKWRPERQKEVKPGYVGLVNKAARATGYLDSIACERREIYSVGRNSS